MKRREDIIPGDVVEVLVLQQNAGQREPQEHWIPCMVIALDAMQIGVQSLGGEKLAIPLHKTDLWRPSKHATLVIRTKWGMFTLDMLQQIQEGLRQAERENKLEFVAAGGVWLTSFATYLIEHAKNEGMVL